MMKKIFIGIAMLLTLFCVSCSKENPYGKKIEENLEMNVKIEDNYRNYYEIFVRSFYDSNKDGIGDLNGVTAKLDYIKDLGYNGIWLMPIHPSDSYHGYDVNDYYQVNSAYGTLDDFKKLSEECHKRDIKLIIDLALNHSGLNSTYFKRATSAYNKQFNGQPLTDQDKKYVDFYNFYPDKASVPNGVTAYRPTGRKFYYEGNFSSNMPEFNCDSPYVLEEFQNIIKFWLDNGADGFRLDAVKYYYIGNNKKNVELLSKINEWTKKIKPDAYIVGECWDSKSIIEDYYESGCDSFFNFPASVSSSRSPMLNFTNRSGLSTYYSGLLSNADMAKGYIPAPFLDNHDTPRYTSPSSPHLSKYQFALMAMMNGTIFTYYGDEVGLVGTNVSPNRDEDVRIPIRWGEENGDCTIIANATNKDYPYPTVKEQMEDRNSIYSFYKKVLLVRNQNPEIARGKIELIELDNEETKLLFISKEYEASKIGIIFNFSTNSDLVVDFKSQGFTEVTGQIVVDASEEVYIGMQKNGSIKMPPLSIAIVK